MSHIHTSFECTGCTNLKSPCPSISTANFGCIDASIDLKAEGMCRLRPYTLQNGYLPRALAFFRGDGALVASVESDLMPGK